ncbi:hypothetical protein LTR78_004337 [Recurvomyces mirabilis]|uniref:Uncharacterized protein n=1 Tax=Recurvomyces mirabilis TaxID=574656 RepID=A0AAE0WPQ3_9PEZI|nr:hypothetical protein LTR78_004337 [Recurvomyces mirabilis]KAK5155998.1 hypothetical protein LTS14_005564 [Recurvomyces mirabilis]
MFCASLRRRASFSSVVPALIATEDLKLRESRLVTHDIAIPLSTTPDRQLRLLLLSPTSVSEAKLEGTIARVRHFASLTGGQDISIIFSLEATGTGSTDMLACSKLQAVLIDHYGSIPYIPIIPVPTLASLPEQVKKYVFNLTRPQRIAAQPPLPSPFTLLQHCTTSPPMPQQTAYYLSDLFANLKDLASACSSITSAPNSSSPSARTAGTNRMLSSQDRNHGEIFDADENMPISSESTEHAKLKQLRDLVGEQQCRAIVDFWQEEYVMD